MVGRVVEIKKVVVGVDGTESANRAAAIAGALARHAGAVLTLLFVHDTRSMARLALETTSAEQLGDVQRTRAAAAFQAARAALGEAPPRIVELTAIGRPGDLIPRIAKDLRADLIVVGSRGRSRAAEVLLGSVAESVLHQASAPVVVAR
jgi:nucleotide-binding universal stress UspA family protein